MMGDKVRAKEVAVELGLPVVPGSDGAVADDAEAMAVAERVGYPVLIKAAAGGGGKGMKLAHASAEMAEALSLARNEARAHFGNDAVYIEKYLSHPRHIEIQVLADSHGNVVHLGERDCSLQRRHQKVLEEAPSPALNAAERARIGAIVVDAMRKLGYRSVGTVEFLFQDGAFYFIEMNTRLQVEHPVTEMITDIDIVREQIRVATGAPLGFAQKDIQFAGHAVECRINAEDPETFLPSPGLVTDFHAPGGLGVRVDSALYAGYRVPPHYDSLIAKLVVHGKTRNECLMRLRRALEEIFVGGIKSNIELHRRLIAEPDFINGDYDIRWLERFVAAES
jgi:acetyl-CoA carboxylase biotin carboxylase subunit